MRLSRWYYRGADRGLEQLGDGGEEGLADGVLVVTGEGTVEREEGTEDVPEPGGGLGGGAVPQQQQAGQQAGAVRGSCH